MAHAEPSLPPDGIVEARLDALIGDCLSSLHDVAALRHAVDGLGALEGQRAEFVLCLFSLELALLGEQQARAAFAEHAGVLLLAHRDAQLAHSLLGGNPGLSQRWLRFEPILAEFDRRTAAASELITAPEQEAFAPTEAEAIPAHPQFSDEGLIASAFTARNSLEGLHLAMGGLLAMHDERRREFALCLFNLELARLGEEEAKRGFASRASLLWEAYCDGDVAAALVGSNSELNLLWADLVPYLDEFFDTSYAGDEASEFVLEPISGAELAAAAGDSASPTELEAMEVDDSSIEESEEEVSDLEVVENVEAQPPPPRNLARPGTIPPPPPRDATPKPGSHAAYQAERGKSGRFPVLRKGPPPPPKPAAVPPPPPPSKGEESNPETLRFWTFTEKALDLLPDEDGLLSGRRAFAATNKKERHQLEKFARALTTQFPGSPEARALASLVQIDLACQLKEKTLFGKPNEQRREFLRAGLSLITGDGLAAGHAAVLFDADGVQTLADFGKVVDTMHGYLKFCFQQSLDPTQPGTVEKFVGAP